MRYLKVSRYRHMLLGMKQASPRDSNDKEASSKTVPTISTLSSLEVLKLSNHCTNTDVYTTDHIHITNSERTLTTTLAQSDI